MRNIIYGILICFFSSSCQIKKQIVVEAEISNKPIFLVLKKEDTDDPEFKIPYTLKIKNTYNKQVVFAEVYFNRGGLRDNVVYEVINSKLYKKNQTFNDTIILKPQESKEYIVYLSKYLYPLKDYPDFKWQEKKKEILKSNNDTLYLSSFKTFKKKHSLLCEHIMLTDSVKTYFLDLKKSKKSIDLYETLIKY